MRAQSTLDAREIDTRPAGGEFRAQVERGGTVIWAIGPTEEAAIELLHQVVRDGALRNAGRAA